MADKLSTSRREIPEATVWVDVDATDLLAARAAINARRPEEPVSVLALLSRFVIAGLQRYPELNGRIENGELVLPRAVGSGSPPRPGAVLWCRSCTARTTSRCASSAANSPG